MQGNNATESMSQARLPRQVYDPSMKTDHPCLLPRALPRFSPHKRMEAASTSRRSLEKQTLLNSALGAGFRLVRRTRAVPKSLCAAPVRGRSRFVLSGEAVDFQYWAAYDAEMFDESKVRERVEGLISRCGSVKQEIGPEQYSWVLHGTTGVIVLLYGRDSAQLSAFQQALSDTQKRVDREYYDSQLYSLTQVVSGVLHNMLAELDSGLIGSIRQQVAAEVLSDFVALSRAALEEAGGQGKNVAAVLGLFQRQLLRVG
jgi:hypothetical protein